MKVFARLASAAVLSIAIAASASAAVITYNLDFEFSGAATPLGTFMATLDDTACGLDCVELTMSATGPDTDEFVGEWLFNFDPALDLGDLVFAHISGTAATVNTGVNAFKADGGRHFDIQFDFPQPAGSRFNVGDPDVVYNITGIAGLSASDFDFLAEHISGNGGGAHSAAHIQGIDAAPGSGWITDSDGGDPGGELPEPNVLWLLGTALVGFGFAYRRRQRG
jgi:hypothetical protein